MGTKNSCRFFCNKECEWFPCHSASSPEDFNCLFCYCPLIPYPDCGGNYMILDNGWKDCSNCTLPHKPEGYSYILEKIIEFHNRENNI